MKIYLHQFKNLSGDEIITTEIEAEEKEKIYRYKDRGCNRIVKKDNIGKLDSYIWIHMYTLTPDRLPFLSALLEQNARDIDFLCRKLARLKTVQDFILAEQKKALNEVTEQTDICAACGKAYAGEATDGHLCPNCKKEATQ